MSEQRCKNCKHWQNEIMTYHKDERVLHPYGVCNRIKMDKYFGYYPKDPESVLDDEPAVLEDGSGYHAALRPGPEFGCVLWETNNENT